MKDIVSIMINLAVAGFIVYGFISTGGKLSTFGIIVNIIAMIAVCFSTYINIKNIKNSKNRTNQKNIRKRN